MFFCSFKTWVVDHKALTGKTWHKNFITSNTKSSLQEETHLGTCLSILILHRPFTIYNFHGHHCQTFQVTVTSAIKKQQTFNNMAHKLRHTSYGPLLYLFISGHSGQQIRQPMGSIHAMAIILDYAAPCSKNSICIYNASFHNGSGMVYVAEEAYRLPRQP